jgi:dihydroorotate dehydrogenase
MPDLFQLARPLINMLDGEKAHRLTINALKFTPRFGAGSSPQSLPVSAFGLDFPNPLGLAAGFDKNAEVIEPILRLGLGFTEIGGVTPLPQSGNAKPRVFRLPKDAAIINRYGLNSAGMNVVRAKLENRNRSTGLMGVNIGANKDTSDRVGDYVTLVRGLSDVADYISVNISSPNTPGLRNLQGKAELDALLERVMEAKTTCPILVKIAPDLELSDLDDVIEVAKQRGIDGLIVSNTTIARPTTLLETKMSLETGGLSGRPVFARSTWLLAQTFLRIEDDFPLIGVGGIDSAETAWTKICAGATLLQLYTALVYQGPALIGRILSGLEVKLKEHGFSSIKEAVGCRAKEIGDDLSS